MSLATSNGTKLFDYLPLIGVGLPFMIRDTFEANPGLCELFKRMILDRARGSGLSEDLIDFETQIDMKGTYQDNLRIFYREYPQLSENSDYFRIKSIRPLSGAVLEQAWRGYERNNGHGLSPLADEPSDQPPIAEAMMPELVITYTIGREPVTAGKGALKEPEPVSIKPSLPQTETSPTSSTHREIVKSILDRVTAIAGEKVTKTILYQIGQEIGGNAFNHLRDQISSGNLVEALDHALSIRGWGRVLDISKTNRGSSVTYECAVRECSLCHNQASMSPTCGIMRGIVSRWLESFVQKNAESIETACVAGGSQPCVFRVTFRK